VRVQNLFDPATKFGGIRKVIYDLLKRARGRAAEMRSTPNCQCRWTVLSNASGVSSFSV
jgi:hypothetical protein